MANKKVKFELTAVDKTKAAFDKVTKGLKGVGSVAGKATMGIAKIGLAATGAATALAALVKVNVDFMDKLGKTADKLGIEVEFLQAMRFAAEQTGVKVEALDMGLQRFIRRAAEAAKGTGESKRAFEQLGIELKNDDGTLRDVRDVLFDVADGLKNTRSSAERIRLAFKFFDSEGVALVNTLKNGADGLRDFEQQAENLGIIISKQSIAKAAMFADSLNVLKKQITAITANISAAFIPILEDVATHFETILSEMKGSDTTFENFGKNLAVTILEFMRSSFIGFVAFIDGIKQKIAEFAGSKIGKQIFGDMFDENDALRAEFDKTKKRYEQLQRSFLSDNQVFIDIWGGSETIQGGEALQAEILKVRDQLLQMYKEIHGDDPENNPVVLALDTMISRVKDFKIETKKDNGGDDVVSTMSEAVSKFKDSLGATDASISNLTINATKRLEDSIIEGLKTGKLAFKDFADYAIEQIIRIALQQAILAPMTGSIESFFKGVFGKKALGGSVNAGKPYMVGESGRELFVPNQSGQIVSNQDLKQMGGGQSAPTVNFNISTVDAAGFDELLASRKGLITSIINNAMNNRGRMGVT
jgi:regulator of replication initiation timing